MLSSRNHTEKSGGYYQIDPPSPMARLWLSLLRIAMPLGRPASSEFPAHDLIHDPGESHAITKCTAARIPPSLPSPLSGKCRAKRATPHTFPPRFSTFSLPGSASRRRVTRARGPSAVFVPFLGPPRSSMSPVPGGAGAGDGRAPALTSFREHAAVGVRSIDGDGRGAEWGGLS